jgi:murein DD-endopeptidase MepM/ murein hydrolase activator NlpD
MLVVAAAFFACGGGGDDNGGIVVSLVTPVPTAGGPTPVRPGSPAATGTAIATPELVLSTTQVFQAGAVLVSVTGQVTGGAATFLGRKYTLIQGSKSMYTFAAVDTGDPAGPQPLKVDVTLPNGTKATLTDTIAVIKTAWTVDAIDFTDEQTTDLLDPKVVNDELALLTGIYSKVTPEKLWGSAWQLPVEGPLTARFGEQRSINGGPASGHHGGTDFAAETGTPVLATNRGRVVLVRKLNVRGNMVIIDHGGGLFSGYAHLSTFHVTEGQLVEAGDVIAEVGTTGLSTGPHLHWEMASNGILLDALRFTDGSNGF